MAKLRKVKKVKTPGGFMVPAKYVAGLSGEPRKKRLLALEKMRKSGKVLGDLPGDKTSSGKRRKTKESIHTKKFRKMYGNKRKTKKSSKK